MNEDDLVRVLPIDFTALLATDEESGIMSTKSYFRRRRGAIFLQVHAGPDRTRSHLDLARNILRNIYSG